MISADALQVYKHLNIGTAKPDPDTLKRTPHHLIDIIDYTQSFNVGEFCLLADECVQEILGRGRLPVISGGTAYYLKAWLMGMPETPTADAQLRNRLETQWAGKDDASLRDAVRRIDPVSADRIGKRDRYRMLRALEVHAQTGQPLSGFNLPSEVRTDYQVLSIGLSRDRKELYGRINERVDSMMAQGLSSELASLRENGAKRSDPGMKAIGYREWFRENGEQDSDVDRVRELIARNTRRYAKRQITFFSTLPNVRWFDAGEDTRKPGGLEETVKAFLGYDVSSQSLDQDASVGDNP